MGRLNLGHAAALALVGWYLMVPPRIENTFPNEKAPISQWVIVMSADSAYFCEQLRIAFQNKEEAKWRADLAKGWAAHPETNGAIRNKVDEETLETVRKSAPVSYATCVSTDDPRLKEK